MNKPSSSGKSWWSSFGFRRAEAEPDTDYADMGTAFGLDASMHPRPSEQNEEGEQRPAPERGPR